MWTRQIKVKRVTDKEVKKQQDQLVFEKEISLIINNSTSHNTSISRGNEQALLVGYAWFHQHISSADHIKDLHLEDETLALTSTAESHFTPQTEQTHPINPEEIFRLTASIQEKALLFKNTAISESAAIFSGDQILSFAEDINQINAIYKCLGVYLEQKHPPQRLGLFTSAKVDHQLASHARALGIGLIVSRVGVTDLAYDYASDHTLNLVGFARGRRLNIYTG